ncbi:MAG: putative membrane protein [Flavobacteriales bacterium]|jgi:uncharacterized membrane protein
MVKVKRKNDSVILTLQPNRSANWRQNKIIILLITAFVMSIAMVWSVMGVWMILPFAGFEVGLLAFVMYRVSYFTYQKQIITINNRSVTFESGVYYSKQCLYFDKKTLSVITIEPQTAFEQTLISLEDKQKKVIIGQFLNQQDRQTTLTHFQEAQLYVHSDKWWKSN